jgi:hypothetical protein
MSKSSLFTQSAFINHIKLFVKDFNIHQGLNSNNDLRRILSVHFETPGYSFYVIASLKNKTDSIITNIQKLLFYSPIIGKSKTILNKFLQNQFYATGLKAYSIILAFFLIPIPFLPFENHRGIFYSAAAY